MRIERCLPPLPPAAVMYRDDHAAAEARSRAALAAIRARLRDLNEADLEHLARSLQEERTWMKLGC